MDFAEVIPRELHPFLKWLGNLKEEWLDLRVDIERRTMTTPRREWIAAQPGAERFHRELNHILNNKESLVLSTVDALARCIATGPKIFYPTAEQYDSMQHVDLRIPIADYRQPYPALIVKIPSESRARLAVESGVELSTCPTWLLIHQRKTSEDRNWMFIMHPFQEKHRVEVTHAFQDRPEFATMEDAILTRIAKEGDKPEQSEFAERSSRAALNLMLMLVHYGHKDGGPLHPEQHAKHRKRKDLAHLSHGDFTTVQMIQDVVIRKVQPRADHEPIPSGREMPPHWRRGHWRSQRHGPGNTLTKTIFVNPVLVRGDRAVGELAETVATYHVR
jgi:hypothetical protein